jgi:hypothetical protein
LLSRLVVRPIESLDNSEDEWRLAGKLNFLFDGDFVAFKSVVGGARSSDDNITSGVQIARVGFDIIMQLNPIVFLQ